MQRPCDRGARRALLPALLAAALAAPTLAQDWSNQGGNAARNGRSDELGPLLAHPAWSDTDDFSVIAWHPYVSDGRVFTIRESGFPSAGGAANDALVAYDLETGQELWRTTLAYGGNPDVEWIAWIAGVSGGRVFASRSENAKPGPIRAYDAATGQFLWNSQVVTQAFAYEGAVFAPNGDLVVGDRLAMNRIDAATGATVWSTPRSCSVSGNCGPAATDTAVFYDEVVPGGQVITKVDLATGTPLYSSTLMPGFTEQNQPFLSPDGSTVYHSRTQNNPLTDFLYAFDDTGTALVERWHREVRWTTSHEHGVADDGSVYTFLPTNELVRIDAATGAVTANAGVLPGIGTGNLSPKTVVDGEGKVYVSNGWTGTPSTNGRVWAFDADLTTLLFTLNLDNPNQGGPALGADGVLVVSDRIGVHAYRCPRAGATFRNAGTNPASYAASAPALGTTFTATVDLGNTTGHLGALLLGFRAPANLPLGSGQVVLVDFTSGPDLLKLPIGIGDLAQFQLAIPSDASLCGIELATQAVHFGGVPGFALSNAQDLVVGPP